MVPAGGDELREAFHTARSGEGDGRAQSLPGVLRCLMARQTIKRFLAVRHLPKQQPERVHVHTLIVPSVGKTARENLGRGVARRANAHRALLWTVWITRGHLVTRGTRPPGALITCL
eukprot:2165411-Prymnesium_polylepis.1